MEPLRAFACLEGMEGILAEELRRLLPAATPFDLRPGLLVLRDPGLDPTLTIAEPVHPAFARAEFTAWSALEGLHADEAAAAFAGEIADVLDPDAEPPALHVWAQAEKDRDERVDEARALERALRRELGGAVRSKIAAAPGDDVIDIVTTGKGEWVSGAHRRTPIMSAFPGGQRRLAAREDAPSRSHLKLEEGLEWAELPLEKGDVAVDVGCAPGGWSFVLLERGLVVHGVDPTPVADSVASNESFRWHRGPVRTFEAERAGRLRWIFCDMNGPPLDALGQIERLAPRCQGLEAIFHTIKLSDDPPLAVLDEVRRRVRALGFADLRVRHLYHNRQELTLVARRR